MDVDPRPEACSPGKDTISGILVRLTVGGDRYLRLLIGSDGALERGGRGEKEFMGKTVTGDLFSQILESVTPDLLRWSGQSWSDPAARGKTCELLIGFRLADGSETAIRWEYGSDSPEPPREVREFVLAAVECTNPWYRRQIELRQQRARRPKSEGWRLVSLWPTVDASMENSR